MSEYWLVIVQRNDTMIHCITWQLIIFHCQVNTIIHDVKCYMEFIQFASNKSLGKFKSSEVDMSACVHSLMKNALISWLTCKCIEILFERVAFHL